MPVLHVKDCPAQLYESLRGVAEHEHRSIAQQTIVAVQEHVDGHTAAVGLGRRAALDRILAREPIQTPAEFPDAADVVRELRESR